MPTLAGRLETAQKVNGKDGAGDDLYAHAIYIFRSALLGRGSFHFILQGKVWKIPGEGSVSSQGIQTETSVAPSGLYI